MTRQKRRIFLMLSAFAFIAIAFVVLLYSQGYILDSSLNFSQRGGLYIAASFPNSDIYINNKKEKATNLLNSGLFKSNLQTGEYSVLVAKEDFWPWAKTLEVKEGLVTEARAFMLPKESRGEILIKGKFFNIWSSPDQKILALQEQKNNNSYLTFYVPTEDNFLTASSQLTQDLLSFNKTIFNIAWGKDSLSFKSNKGIVEVTFNFSDHTVTASYGSNPLNEEVSDFEKISSRGNEKIWWDPQTNEVFVEWLKKSSPPPYYICGKPSCDIPTQIFNSHLNIKNIDFFPGRKDVIVIAIGNGVYALEIDGRGEGRLLYPVYKGKDPSFSVLSDGNIYITDDGSLLKIYSNTPWN